MLRLRVCREGSLALLVEALLLLVHHQLEALEPPPVMGSRHRRSAAAASGIAAVEIPAPRHSWVRAPFPRRCAGAAGWVVAQQR